MCGLAVSAQTSNFDLLHLLSYTNRAPLKGHMHFSMNA